MASVSDTMASRSFYEERSKVQADSNIHPRLRMSLQPLGADDTLKKLNTLRVRTDSDAERRKLEALERVLEELQLPDARNVHTADKEAPSGWLDYDFAYEIFSGFYIAWAGREFFNACLFAEDSGLPVLVYTRPAGERLVVLRDSADVASLLREFCRQDDRREDFDYMGTFAMAGSGELCEPEELQIPFDKKHLPAVLTLPDRGPPRYGVVLTHGAGGDLDHAHLRGVAQVLARAGYLCLRFTCKALNIGYRIRAFTAAMDYLRKEIAPTLQGCFVGGRSMGSRAAAGVALADTSGFVRGVICLSYPLHPPGQPDKLRTDVFRLSVPTLFISGTKDPMCPAGSFREHVRSMGETAAVRWVEGGDHGVKVPGRAADDVCEEICSAVVPWCNAVCDGTDWNTEYKESSESMEGTGGRKRASETQKAAEGSRARKRRQ
ncbi:TEX30 [Branchiostoma lanceolatum]|uniref:TEX30 protein n=1 Tax=Branchiostoma lanceolatum TaxID=7740 RepID=A0A8J9ZT10_BRALA|nr:TEX30 [Branchiostoma lanceolatum]